MAKTQEWISLAKAALFFDIENDCGGKPTYSTIRAWCDRGVINKRTGNRIYLRTRQVGGRRMTCQKYYDKFIEDLNEGEEEE